MTESKGGADSGPATRSPAFIAVMVAVFLAAVDQTVVGTALPRITQELGDPALYTWVFTSYLMATTAFVPIAGAMGDVYGRRPVLLFGVFVFALGSALAGASTSMLQLVIFRGVQGIGAGVLTSNAFAFLGDVFPTGGLARATGLMSAVYGLAGAVGPLLGGVLTDYVGWEWIFWLNVPPCLLVGCVFWARLPRRTEGGHPAIDVAGALALLATLLPGLAALSWAGEGAAWDDPGMLGALGLSAVFGVSFLVIEARSARPIIAMHLFRGATFSASMLAMFSVALAMYAAISYAPLLFQTLLQMSATHAGVVTAPLVVTLAVTAVIAGRMIEGGGGYTAPAAAGALIAAAGMAWLSQLDAGSSMFAAAGSMAFVGAGLGLTMPTLLLAAQASVSPAHLGVTTGLAKFSRSIGGLVGVAAAGAAIRYFEPALGSHADAVSRTMLLAAGAMLVPALLAFALPGRNAVTPGE